MKPIHSAALGASVMVASHATGAAAQSAEPDYIYGARVEGTGLDDESRTQNDVQIAFGFGFPVGR